MNTQSGFAATATVTHVATATDAVNKAAELGPEVAVIDIGLPDGNGIDVLSALGSGPGHPSACRRRFHLL